MKVADIVRFKGKKYEAHAGFWNSCLAQYGEGCHFGEKAESPAVTEEKAATLPPDFFTGKNEATIFVYILASLGILLKRQYGVKYITVHSPLYRDESAETESTAVVPLFLDIDEEVSFRDLLGNVQQVVQQCYGYQHYPLSLLTDEAESLPFPSNILVVYDGFHEPVNNTDGYDLVIKIETTENGIRVCFINSPGFVLPFKPEEITAQFLKIIGYRYEPQVIVKDIGILTEAEQKQLLFDFNDTAVITAALSLPERFSEQVKLHPDEPAVIFEGTVLTYRELNERSCRLANHLRTHFGVQRESLVAIMTEHSEQLVIAVLAVLQAGGAYLPVDPSYPAERKKTLLEIPELTLLLTDTTELLQIDYYQGRVFALDAEEPLLQNSTANPEPDITGNDLAYVIYTSGSTGKPKGTQITHKSLNNYLSWALEYYTGDGICGHSALFTSLSFDFTITSIFCPLLCGKSLRVYRQSQGLDTILKDVFSESTPADLIKLTPSHISMLGQLDIASTNVKRVIVGGEELTLRQVAILRSMAGEIDIINEYGPTEATVGCIIKRIASESKILIGKPISNMQAYIMDSEGGLCGAGITGEIYLGGIGLSRGYLHQPELTSLKFVPNRYAEGLLYKTGDLGRWHTDGNIEYLGRADEQVKIRGYRVELGEIQTIIEQFELIEAALVIMRTDNAGEKQLVAYIVTANESVTEPLRARLQQLLPDYMVPAHFVVLDKIPLTSNGKADRRALPEPGKVTGDAVYAAPRTATEAVLVKIWEEVLAITPIGIHDNFFNIGGHSLIAVRIASGITRELHVKIELRTIFQQPTIAGLATVIATATAEEFKLIDHIPDQEHYALSHAQRRLWILHHMEKQQLAYNIPGAYRFKGPLDIASFRKAFERLAYRHEILRTGFIQVNGEPRQQVFAPEAAKIRLDYTDLRAHSNRYEQVDDYAQAEASHLFDLSEGRLLRACLLQTEDEEFVFLLTIHHIVSDEWSMGLIVNEILELYEAFREKKEDTLPPLRIQYRDYAHWQNKELADEQYSKHREYWLNQFKHSVPSLELPFDFPRPPVKTYNGACCRFTIDKLTTAKLKQLGSENEASLFMLLLTTVNVLLHRYTGQDDFVIGSSVAGRYHRDLEDQIGFYVNSLALRNSVDGKKNFEEMLMAVRDNTLSAYEHQVYPFDRLVDELDLERDISRSPLFDVVLALHNTTGITSTKEMQGIVVAPLQEDTNIQTSKHDITFNCMEADGEILVFLEYNTDLFTEGTMRGIGKNYIHLVASITENSLQPISLLSCITPEEESLLLNVFNPPSAMPAPSFTMSGIFEKQVLLNPEGIALIHNSTELTYRELNEQSNKLAHHLREGFGITTGGVVGIYLERSVHSIIAILAVLKAGGVYLPMDTGWPRERMQYVAEEAEIKLLITESSFLFELDTYTQDNLFMMDIQLEGLAGRFENPEAVHSGTDLGYIIYTSGSTGHPKGVMIEQRSLVNMSSDQALRFGVTAADRVLQFASLSFDASVYEIFMSVCGGATLVIAGKELINDPEKFTAYLSEKGVSVVTLPPVYLKVLDKTKLDFLRVIITAGEAAHVDEASSLSGTLDYYNGYGPTECAVCVSVYKVSPADAGRRSIPVGKAVSNLRVYIMDEKLQLVPVGVKGEICVAGTGVGRGYVKQPALTAQKFADDPFHAGEKMYCTGDMGRWLPDGNIEFHGRKDNQVKLRGFRIELGEIENLMYQFDGVTAAAVLVKTDAAGDEQLVSYVVTEQPAKINGLTAWLKAKLPPYMVPGFNIVLDKMPFTSSDKIDRKALPSPWDKDASAIKVYTGPENEVQRQLVRIWQEILGHEPIGIHDNFFENGGHSIKAMRMLAEVSKEMNVVIELNTVFRHPTIAALSAIIPSITPVKFQPIARVGLLPDYPLSYAQARLWIMDKFEKDHISFNMPQMYGFEGEFNRPAFEKAMNALVERHESLRTIFPLVNGEPRQKIIPAAESRFHFTYTDLREIPDNESLVASEGAAEASTPFDLSEGPLVRARLLQLRDDKYVLLFTVHHIIFDGWSAGVLTKDFLILYHAFCKGNENPLLPLRIQYKDYTAWQQEQLTGELLHAHEQYWLDRLSGTIPELDISADKERPSVKTYNGNRIIISLSAQQSEQLRTLGREQGTSLFITMVAIFKYLLHRYSGQQDIIVGTTVANRDHPDLADQIGFFINTLPLRTQFSGTETFLEFLALVNNNILRAYAHRDYPFDLLVKKLNIPRDAARSPVFDVQVEQVSIEDKNEPEDEMEGASVSFKDESLLLTKYDLSFRFLDTTNGIIINLEYNTDLFYDKSIAAMGNRLQELINSILENPAITLDAEIQTGNVADKSTGNEQFSNVFNTSDIL